MRTVLLTSNTSFYLWNFRRSTIEALLKKGYRVNCIAPEDEYTQRLQSLGVNFFSLPLDGASTHLIKEGLSFVWILFHLIRHRPDFVFNFTIKMNLYVGIPCRFLSIPYANNVSGLGTAFLHEGLAFRLARKAYGFSNKAAELVFFQNEEDRQTFIDQELVNIENAQLIPGSGVDTQRFVFSDFLGGDLVFIFIGRVIADKGAREFIEAARRIKQEYPDIRFLLLGAADASNASALSKTEIEQVNKEGVIEYLGHQDDVVPWLKQSHVLVLPSYREGMPKTVLEAASMGRPAIVSDVPGCRQSIEVGKTGWFCEAKNSADLAEVIKSVVELDRSSLERYSVNAGEKARKEFAEHIVVSAYMDALPD